MNKRQLDMTEHKIWKDKKINPECKRIYAYVYSKGLNRISTDINVGELQQYIPITNVGLRKNLNILQKFKYLIFKEYDKGMYEIHIC